MYNLALFMYQTLVRHMVYMNGVNTDYIINTAKLYRYAHKTYSVYIKLKYKNSLS